MRAILANGATLVFCSHNLYQVREMCRQAVAGAGQGADVGGCANGGGCVSGCGQGRHGEQRVVNMGKSVEVLATAQRVPSTKPAFKPAILSVHIRASQGKRPLADVHVGIVIRRNDVQCYGISTRHDGADAGRR